MKSTLLFVIPTMGHGGAQRVMAALLDYICNSTELTEYTNIHLLTFRKETDPVHSPHPRVKIENINSIQSTSASVSMIASAPPQIRKAIKRINPNLIVSFQDIANFPTLIASIGLGIPVIVSERNDPRHYTKAKLRAALRNILYPLANRIIVQTTNIAEQMPSVTFKKTEIIPNAVPIAPLQAMPAISIKGKFTVMCAGRLEHQKDHLLLIEAFAETDLNTHNWDLRIYGEGSLRTSLENRIKDLDLESRASVEPATVNIYHALATSHLFVLSSEHEGFPNILAEAVATGLPSIGYQSVSGVTELIHDSKNGLLLNDTNRNKFDLARAMLSLMNDSEKRKSMGENCKEIAKEFQPEAIYSTWANFILSR